MSGRRGIRQTDSDFYWKLALTTKCWCCSSMAARQRWTKKPETFQCRTSSVESLKAWLLLLWQIRPGTIAQPKRLILKWTTLPVINWKVMFRILMKYVAFFPRYLEIITFQGPLNFNSLCSYLPETTLSPTDKHSLPCYPWRWPFVLICHWYLYHLN